MKNFLKIATLYSDSTERNVDFLSTQYLQSDILKNVIHELTEDILTDELLKGKRVLLKPNWVKHSSIPDDDICLRTHDNFILAILELILYIKPKQIVIGDAPIQGCNWEEMISPGFISTVNKLSNQYSIPIEIKDFRRTTFDPVKNNPVRERLPMSDYLIFDLGKESLLEEVSNTYINQFRVTDYNPDLLAKVHHPGVHQYCITRELFISDVIISLPKVKTHQKAGITAAMKNLVGLNGDKDYLPHHRLGGTNAGGDCYPGSSYLRYLAELSLDNANRKQGSVSYKLWRRISSFFWHLSFPNQEKSLSAGWYGNDTTWRMVMDLNKIAMFGKADGSISATPQRTLFSLCDGIIGGQGDGPLRPEPLPLGIISFTDHSAMNDVVMAALMGFDYGSIPLLKSAMDLSGSEWPGIILNHRSICLEELTSFSVKTKPPSGWKSYLKSRGA